MACIFLAAFSWPLRAAEPFSFVADDSPAAVVAQALAEHYQISLFLPGEVGAKKVSGVLRGANLEESLDLLSYFCGATWRKQGAVYYFGGAEPAQFYTFSSAGLDINVLRSVFGEVSIVGDNVVVKSTPTQFAQMQSVAQKLIVRKVLRLRCTVVDIAESAVPAFYDFLKSATVGVSKTGNGLHGSVTMPTNISVILDFLQSQGSTKMKLDSEFEMPSGESLTVASGSIIETELYVRPNQSDQDLVTQIDRRQLGLTVRLTPYEYDDKWFVRYDVQDADSAAGTERRLAINGSVDLRALTAVKLASITREKETTVDKRVPGISKVPLIGRAFRSKGTSTETRVVMVFIQRID